MLDAGKEEEGKVNWYLPMVGKEAGQGWCVYSEIHCVVCSV